MRNTGARSVQKTTCASISETNKPKLTTQQVQFSLKIIVVQSCEVDSLFAARLAHTRLEEDPRQAIRACGQPMQKSMIDRAYADLYRDDRRFLEKPEHSVGAILLALSVEHFWCNTTCSLSGTF